MKHPPGWGSVLAVVGLAAVVVFLGLVGGAILEFLARTGGGR